MAWLWLVSVGITDVQFPVWKKDEYGQWSPRRFNVGRGGTRAVHRDLLALLKQDLITFPEQLPPAVYQEEARDLRLELMEGQGSFVVTITTAKPQQQDDYRISSSVNEIPNAEESRLPLFCPKVRDALGVARDTFGAEPVSVVVFNTRRDETLPDGLDEPIASGPVVAKFLAERLGLNWSDNAGEIPDQLKPGVSTWIDILTGHEPLEDVSAQQAVVHRITNLVKAWNPAGKRLVAITTSGGMPPLKSIIEHVPATCLGQGAIRLLDRPERGAMSITAVNFMARVAERETLRFHCAEALRQGDFTSAYGLASRFGDQPWSGAVRALLGPLLELPGGPLQYNGRTLEPFVLYACQVELALAMGDIAGALRRVGPFIESTIWEVISRNEVIEDLKLTVDHDGECLCGDLEPHNELFILQLLKWNERDTYRHRVLGLTWDWPKWLDNNAGMSSKTESAMFKVAMAYSAYCDNNYTSVRMSPKSYRNKLVHGSSEPINLDRLEKCLKTSGLMKDIHMPFGQNFLLAMDVNDLMFHLGYKDLVPFMKGLFRDLLQKVIEG